MCRGVVLDGNRLPCLDKDMKSEKNSKFAQGWMCPRGDFCQDKPDGAKEGAHTQYVLCIKCLRVNLLLHRLPELLDGEAAECMKIIDTCKLIILHPSNPANSNTRQRRRPLPRQVRAGLYRHPFCQARLWLCKKLLPAWVQRAWRRYYRAPRC